MSHDKDVPVSRVSLDEASMEGKVMLGAQSQAAETAENTSEVDPVYLS